MTRWPIPIVLAFTLIFVAGVNDPVSAQWLTPATTAEAAVPWPEAPRGQQLRPSVQIEPGVRGALIGGAVGAAMAGALYVIAAERGDSLLDPPQLRLFAGMISVGALIGAAFGTL